MEQEERKSAGLELKLAEEAEGRRVTEVAAADLQQQLATTKSSLEGEKVVRADEVRGREEAERRHQEAERRAEKAEKDLEAQNNKAKAAMPCICIFGGWEQANKFELNFLGKGSEPQLFNMEYSLQDGAAATLLANGKVLVSGGCDICSNEGSANCEIWDPVNHESESVPALPEQICYHSMALLDGTVFKCGGGRNNFFSAVSAVCHTLRGDSWAEIASLRKPRMNFAMVPFNGRLYAIGGFNEDEKHDSVVEVYDPQSDSWTQLKAKLPFPAMGLRAAVLDGRIFVTGGCDYGAVAKTRVLDPRSDGWTTGPAMKIKRYRHGLVLLGGRLYAFGGSDGNKALDSIEVYEPRTNAWSLIDATLEKPNSSFAFVGLE